MKKTILLAALGLISLSALAQDKPQEEGFVFTTVKENPITSIKNQNRSSTCWSFSSLGFLESELLRTGKGEYDLSEMFVVHAHFTGGADRHLSVFFFHRTEWTNINQNLWIFYFFLMYY